MAAQFRRISWLLALSLISSLEMMAQDVTVFLTAKFQGSALPLDSVLLENITKEARLMLTGLPPSDSTYMINLSKGKITNDVMDINDSPYGFFLVSNRPGELRFLAGMPKPGPVTVNLYDLPGRLVFSRSENCPSGVALFTVNPKRHAQGIVMAMFDGCRESFKTIGALEDHQEATLLVESVWNQDLLILKNDYPEDFIFTLGDSVRFTVYQHEIYPGSLTAQPQNKDSINVGVTRPCPGSPIVTDYDGNNYKTVQIGNQCWMKENLKTIHYANGIPLVDGTGVPTIDITTKYWFNYNDDPAIAKVYGKLYAWAAVMNGQATSNEVPSGVQGVCPNGWHVPGKAEFEILIDYLGGDQVAGGKLKESGNEHWNSPNIGGDNQSGFTAFAGGMQNIGHYCNFRESCHYWTSTEYDSSDAYMTTIYTHLYETWLDGWRVVKQYGNSVRCLKD